MENELIKIKNDNGKQLVSARELHEFLEVKSIFSTWFKRMIEYGFEKDIDFYELWSDSKNGNAVEYLGSPQKMSANGYELDYIITIDMAKELSMIQRTEKGKQARKYFIQCERKQREALKELELVDLKLDESLVYSKNNEATTTSIIIANKFKKRHDSVIRDIENKIQELNKTEKGKQFSHHNFVESTYMNDRGKTYKQYELTEQGFSFVALGYTGEKANEFKIDFINAFFKMKETITNMYKARVLENVLPQKTGNRQFVYIIKNLDSSNIKIGVGSNPSKRLKQLQTGSDSELELIYQSYVCSNAFDIENLMHNKFKENHIRGEWYKINPDEVIKELEKQNYVLKSEFLKGIDTNEFFKGMFIK